MNWLMESIKPFDQVAMQAAERRQQQLTKPPGALGKLENIAIQLAGMQGNVLPLIERPCISVFAADHGLAEAGVSAFPQSVTAQMVLNFLNQGAAISVLANHHQAKLEVVDVGVKADFDAHADLVNEKVALGTQNVLQTAAMTEAECLAALSVGKRTVERAMRYQADLFIAGEMGIGNTAISSLLISSLLNLEADKVTGAGTGLDVEGVERKVETLKQVQKIHQPVVQSDEPLEKLQTLGGFEIVAMAGAFLRAAQLGLPVLVDGLIASTAALYAEKILPGAKQWWFFAHQSAEPAHQYILQAMETQPLLNLSMRLGEGSGAALALPILQQACWLHREMATFEQAQVSQKNSDEL